MDSPWRIELFGGVTLRIRDRVIERFQTAKTGAMLAWLAWQRRPVPREALIDLLWPDADLDAGRNRLRVALNSLRRQLEPPGVPGGAVLLADRSHVQLNPVAFITDVVEFEAALEGEQRAQSDDERITCLRDAVRVYRGELLSGFYDEWIAPERTRLNDACLGALRRLSRLLAQSRQYEAALDCARRAVAMDPYGERSHRTIMRLYARTGRPAAAARQYAELTTLLESELGTRPSSATRKLARRYARAARDGGEGTPAPRAGRAGEEGEGEQAARPARREKPAPRARKAARASTEAKSAANGPEPGQQGPPSRGGDAAAPSLPPASAGGGIPLQFTRFHGRQDLLARLDSLLSDPMACPLVTLTGTGGVGKTRLAVEAAARMRERFLGCVWFVSLGELAAGREPLEAVAAAMELVATSAGGVGDLVVECLAAAPSLLVLDDVEAPAAGGLAVAEVLEWLRQRVPQLACVCTSRRRLDLEGESEIEVSPLPVPTSGMPPGDLLACPSVALFVERAQVARADFQVTPGNADALAAVVVRLEGIPLALELAAAWAQVLTPSQMLERLTRRFELLVSRRRTRLERHRSLRAAIEASHELLPAPLQDFFCRCSVFRGGWSLEAAEGVLVEPRSLELLDQLRQYSLVRVDEASEGMRFHLLESLREFADERLPAHERESLGEAHARHFLGVAEQAARLLRGPHSETWLQRLELDHDNLTAALSWWLEHGRPAEALRLAAAAWRFWHGRGYVAEGAQWLHRALDEPLPPGTDVEAQVRVTALEGLGRLAGCLGDHVESLRRSSECLALARSRSRGSEQDPDADAAVKAALINSCIAAGEMGDLEAARRGHADRVQWLRQADDPWDLARALSDLGRAAQVTGRTEEALAALDETLALRRSLRDRWGCADTLLMRGTFPDSGQASCHAEGRAIFATLEDVYGLGATCLNVGSLALEQGDLPLARDLLEGALETFRDLHDQWYEALCLDMAGRVARRQGDERSARVFLVEALALRRELEDGEGIARTERLLAQVLSR